MEEDQRENASIEKDDIQEKDLEAKLSDLETEVPDLETNISSYPKISAENLKRPPLYRRQKDLGKKPDEHCSKFKRKEGTEAQSEEAASPGSFPIHFVMIPLLCVGILLALYIVCTKFSSPPPPNKQLDVEKLMIDLESRFGGQPESTFRVIKGALKMASSENSDSPGIIVLISSREAKETTHGLADTLVQLVSEPLHSVSIDSRSSSSAARLKKEIDDTIRSNLTEWQTRAVLVRDLDRIPFEAAMIFHGFCDHENAPFKRAVYVMTIFVDEPIPPTSEIKHWDALATEHLKSVWRDSGEDQVPSLISRLTVSVAAVISKR